MSDTHINAYVRDLQEARDAAVTAIATFDDAKAAVESHPDFKKGSHSIRLPFEVLYPKPKEEVKAASPREATA